MKLTVGENTTVNLLSWRPRPSAVLRFYLLKQGYSHPHAVSRHVGVAIDPFGQTEAAGLLLRPAPLPPPNREKSRKTTFCCHANRDGQVMVHLVDAKNMRV